MYNLRPVMVALMNENRCLYNNNMVSRIVQNDQIVLFHTFCSLKTFQIDLFRGLRPLRLPK